jgi:hypothetical protein
VTYTRAFIFSFAGAALLLGGVLYYFQTKIFKVTDSPSTRIRSEPFALQTTDTEIRTINLGFSHFSLPNTVTANPVQMHGTLFVSFVSEKQNPILTVCPPVSEQDEAIRKLRSQLQRFTADNSGSWFHALKSILELQPFDVLGAIRKGRRESIRDLTLLVAKSLYFGAARGTVRVFENEITGAFIYDTVSGAFIEVHDKAAAVSQLFIVAPEAGDFDQIASTVIQTYRAVAVNKTEAELLEQLSATGIPNVEAPSAGTDPMNESEESRLEKVVEEVRKRRIERSK